VSEGDEVVPMCKALLLLVVADVVVRVDALGVY
jgi:hypothetical protein